MSSSLVSSTPCAKLLARASAVRFRGVMPELYLTFRLGSAARTAAEVDRAAEEARHSPAHCGRPARRASMLLL